ncbi:MAG: AMP-binding protein [Leptonema sp. (in: Bacteria)]|nr:AMP-binding protein [Leptonema sp. (in: bacteria)]
MEKESLYHLLNHTVRTFAERPVYWVRLEKQQFAAISYFNWRADMKRLQAYLIFELGLQHGDKVGLLCDNRYEWNLISLGLGSIGCIDVPRGCDATEQDILYILNHTECPVLVVEHEKMLAKIVDLISDLPHLRHIICIEGPKGFKNKDKWEIRLSEERSLTQGKIKDIDLHFLVHALEKGQSLLKKHGDSHLKRRGLSIKGDDLATIIYTSGTTGTPKGVMLTHRNFCWEVSQIQMSTPLNENDRAVVFLPPWHIAERILELSLIACGGSMANSSIIFLSGDLQTIQPTVLVSVPRVWEQLYRRIMDNVRKQPEQKRKIFEMAVNIAGLHIDALDNLFDRIAMSDVESTNQTLIRKAIAVSILAVTTILNLPAQIILKKVKDIFGGRLQYAISGAGALPGHIAEFFRSVSIPIIDAYGMTETTAVSAMGRLPLPRRDCVGPTLPGVHIQLRDEFGRIVTRPGERGVAWHKGPHIMKGYYKSEEKTVEVLQDGWLNSGDLFSWTTTGEIRFTGRAKDTIVLAGGENVEPDPIELRLSASPFIAQVVVVGQDRKSLGALIVPFKDRVTEELKNNGYTVPDDMTQWNTDSQVRNLFQEVIKQSISSQNGFKAFEKILQFTILGNEFTKGREMTETMKVKRIVVSDMYAKTIDAMYGDG